jgi:hypothetical protein
VAYRNGDTHLFPVQHPAVQVDNVVALFAMGSKILPFVVSKLKSPERAYCIRCVPLYGRDVLTPAHFLTAFPPDDALQTDPDKKVSHGHWKGCPCRLLIYSTTPESKA